VDPVAPDAATAPGCSRREDYAVDAAASPPPWRPTASRPAIFTKNALPGFRHPGRLPAWTREIFMRKQLAAALELAP